MFAVGICFVRQERGENRLEAKYFRDYKHNYMILQCGQEATVRSYQYKILTSDKIKEILRCSVRHINGTTYYYYDISSRTTLKSLYQSSRMSYEQVKDLLCQLHGIYARLAGFFLEESGLVLLPEHIYYDFSSRKYIGLYYPDYRPENGAVYEPLMNFLLEHIDTEDRKLAENMYRICELAGEAHFLLEDALQILEEREEIRQENVSDQIEDQRKQNSFAEELPPMDAQPEETVQYKRSLFYPVFTLLSLLSLAGAAAVCYLYELTQEEEIALYGIMAVSGVCVLLCLWGSFRAGSKRQNAESGKRESMTGDGGFEAAFAGMTGGVPDRVSSEPPVSMKEIIDKDTSFGMGTVQAESVNTASEHNAAFSTSPKDQETDYYGNTIFFDGSKVAEHKLYAADRRNKQHIQLQQFPCTIGKMAGCVDHVLADNSVSRIHARFDRQGDKILLTDMNSTNGTYKNGLRMQPQETVEIEPGDEIRFGSLNYCYR